MQQVDAIFAEVGQKLRQHREVLGFSLEDVERQTHIRVYYIKALEDGDLNGLPSPVQGRGMLNNYAIFLGLDPDPLLLRFADGLQARLAAKRSEQKEQSTPSPRQPARRPSALRRLLNKDLIVGSLLVVFLLAFTVWGTLRISAMRPGNEPTPTSPSIADVLLNSKTETLTSTPSALVVSGTPNIVSGIELTTPEPPLPEQGQVEGVTQTVTATLAVPLIGEGSIQVSLVILQRAWLRVTVDGEDLFEGRVQPGGAYSYSGDESIEVLTGNGAALRLYYNQQDLGILGSFGEVIQRVFTIEGMQTPTATLTPEILPLPSGTPTSPGGAAATPTSGP
jgi:transcriptional regulator with XRE-family HTH domain